MDMRTALLGILLVISTKPLLAGSERTVFDAELSSAMTRLSREAAVDSDSSFRFAELVEREYGTSEEEMKWALERSLSWGEIAVLAYIQATTGRSFKEITDADAQHDFWTYLENTGMSYQKMNKSLEHLYKQAEKERNSRIFARLRGSRHVRRLPDLGSGFGLFQEALDFRRIDTPAPTKVHSDAGGRAKVDGGTNSN